MSVTALFRSEGKLFHILARKNRHSVVATAGYPKYTIQISQTPHVACVPNATHRFPNLLRFVPVQLNAQDKDCV